MSQHDKLFATHKLNGKGQQVVDDIKTSFTALLLTLEKGFPLGGREGAIVRSKLEEACFYAVKCAALQEQFQEDEIP